MDKLSTFFLRMKLKNPLTLKYLIVLGLSAAIIPLLLGVMFAVCELKETSALNRTINSQVFEQTKTMHLVLQKASDIERKARLFLLLSDPALKQPYDRESYELTRASFKLALSDLLNLHVDNKIALLGNELAEKENLIYQQIIDSEIDKSFELSLDEAFLGFRESSNTLSKEFDDHVEHSFNELHRLSASLEHDLLIKGAVLLFASCLFLLILLTVLSRSWQQLDNSIRRLCSDELQDPIKVNGPADIRYLGERLEWLRMHLITLETSKQQLMEILAHEIKRPLDSLRQCKELLLATTDANLEGTLQDVAEEMNTSAAKLQTMSEQLLKFSQFHATSTLDQKQNVYMQELLESVIEDFQEVLQAKSIRLNKLIRPIKIEGFPKQLRDMLEQLLSNAIKFSPLAGEIRIKLCKSRDRMKLEIEDDGPGIDPDELSHIFEPFYRGTPSSLTEAANQGSGLGLALVQEYVSNHHGKIKFIDPRQDQQGTCVRVQIPLNIED